MSTCGKADCKCPMVGPPKKGNHITVVGMSGAGKTRMVRDMVLHPKAPWDEIIVMCHKCSIEQDDYRDLQKRFKRGSVKMIAGLPEDAEAAEQIMGMLRKNHEAGRATAVIADDVLLDQRKGEGRKFINQLAISGRHLSTSLISILQSPATGDKISRMQTSIYALFRTALADGIHDLCRALDPANKGKRVLKMYHDAVSDPSGHGYLLIDLRHHDLKRFRKSGWNNAYSFEL